MSEAAGEAKVSCTWCGLLSSPGFCDSCGSPLPVAEDAPATSQVDPEPAPAPLAAPDPATVPVITEVPLWEPLLTLSTGPPEQYWDRAEILALVDDPAPPPARPPSLPLLEPLSVLEQHEEPPQELEVEAPPVEESAPLDEAPLAEESPQEETVPIEAAVLDPPQATVPSHDRPEPEPEPDRQIQQGARCPSCGRPGRGVCDVCREAMRELSALGQ